MEHPRRQELVNAWSLAHSIVAAGRWRRFRSRARVRQAAPRPQRTGLPRVLAHRVVDAADDSGRPTVHSISRSRSRSPRAELAENLRSLESGPNYWVCGASRLDRETKSVSVWAHRALLDCSSVRAWRCSLLPRTPFRHAVGTGAGAHARAKGIVRATRGRS